MPLILPAKPAPREISWEKISAANVLSPAFGGAEQELNRKGTRWALTFSMRPMTYVQSMDWDDLESEGQTVVMRVHQPGLDIGTPGQPRVATSGQLGSTVLLDGLTPYYPIRKGQWLSIITGGQRFLYRASALVIAAEDGTASVPLRHPLRKSPLANDVVEIAEPKIEGFPRDVQGLTVGVERLVSLQFTVRERE